MLTLSTFKTKYQKVPVEIYPNRTESKKPVLTVCVFAYNHEAYIAECLDSILAQKTDFDFVVYVGEDDSTDATRAICKEYAKQYPDKIKLFLHDQRNKTLFSGKPCGKFNFMYLLLSVQTEYVAFCDGDDYWTTPQKLQKQVDFLASNRDYSLCFHDIYIQREGQAKETLKQSDLAVYAPLKKAPTIERKDIYHNHLIFTVSTVFRYDPEALEDYIMNLVFADWPMNLATLSKGKGYFIQEPMGVYREHRAGRWTSQQPIYRLRHTLTAKIIFQRKFTSTKEERHHFRIGIAKLYWQITLSELTDKDYLRSLKTFTSGLTKTPVFLLSRFFYFINKTAKKRWSV